MMPWLYQALADAGVVLQPQKHRTTVILTERFEVFLLCSRSSHEPKFVAKVPRDEEAEAMLAREHEILSWLNGAPFASLRGVYPRSYGSARVADRLLWVQSGVPGEHISPNGSPAIYDRMAHWIAALNSADFAPPLAPEDLLHEQPSSESDAGSERQRVADELAEKLANRLPGVLCHGDLNPTNLLIDGDTIRAVDWVWAQRNGRPLFDWFDFCVHLYLTRDGSNSQRVWAALFLDLFDSRSELRERVDSGIRSIAPALRVPEAAGNDLLMLFACSRLWAILRIAHPDAALGIVESSLAKVGLIPGRTS